MKETANLKLPIYELDDAANLADGYNNAMEIIDGAYQQQNEDIGDILPIGTSGIENGAVTTNKISTAAVTGEKIANGAITNDKLSDDFIFPGTSLPDNAVTTPKIADGAVTIPKIAASAFDATPTSESDNLVNSGNIYSYVQSAIADIPEGNGRSLKNVVLIGDSYTDELDTTLYANIGTALKNNFPQTTFYNIADGGSSFTFGGIRGKNFAQQLTAALTEVPENVTIDEIWVIGGRNDAGSQKSAIKTGCNTLITNFKNSRFYATAIMRFFPMLYDWSWINYSCQMVINTIEECASTESKCWVAQGCYSWGLGEKARLYDISGKPSNDIHPNQTGCNEFATRIYNAALNNNPYTWRNREESQTVFSDCTCFFVFKEGMFYVFGNATSPNTSTSIDSTITTTFPTWFWPARNASDYNKHPEYQSSISVGVANTMGSNEIIIYKDSLMAFASKAESANTTGSYNAVFPIWL